MTEALEEAVKQFDAMTKAQIIAELQKLGVKVNPGKKHADLVEILKVEAQKSAVNTSDYQDKAPVVIEEKKDTASKPMSDVNKILAAVGKVADKVEAIDKRVRTIENGDANAFKEAALPEDIQRAEESKIASNVDKRIVAIVEKTLGVDFGITVEGYDDKPGMLLTILVPQRLSPVPMSYRPVKDEETGEYKIDEKTKRIVEEEWWPGDRRSVAMGANDSFEVVQKHVNRVRSFIMATYQKNNRPQPEFRIKQ